MTVLPPFTSSRGGIRCPHRHAEGTSVMTNAHFVIRLSARARHGYLVGYGVIGSTTDSGSVSLGSSPGTPANAANTLSAVSPDSPIYRLVDHRTRAYCCVTGPTSGGGPGRSSLPSGPSETASASKRAAIPLVGGPRIALNSTPRSGSTPTRWSMSVRLP